MITKQHNYSPLYDGAEAIALNKNRGFEEAIQYLALHKEYVNIYSFLRWFQKKNNAYFDGQNPLKRWKHTFAMNVLSDSKVKYGKTQKSAIQREKAGAKTYELIKVQNKFYEVVKKYYQVE